MKLILAHTTYQQPGGEDVVFQAEKELLESQGHTVILYRRSNYEHGAASQALWSHKTYRDLQALIRTTRPDLAHFHNTFFAISPSAYYACKQAGVPVVQTLHNFRLVCPGALLLRNGKPCEDCLGSKFPWPGIRHACWRDSHSQSAVVAAMLGLHHSLGTWENMVDRYIALTDFSRQKFIQGGFPTEKILIKPNFITDPAPKWAQPGEYVLFIGRLSEEKGIKTLLETWQTLPDVPLKIIGNGPFYNFSQEKIIENNLSRVELIGNLTHDEVITFIKTARFVVVPSICYEAFGMVVLESFSNGIPVILSNHGSFRSMVKDGYTGLHFEAGNAWELANKVKWLWNHPEEAVRMGENARREYEKKYTPEINYIQLMDIYQQAMMASQERSS